ncbi:MAG: hypothetical protein AB7E84_03870 [Xanthobacteraceae bacterium]
MVWTSAAAIAFEQQSRSRATIFDPDQSVMGLLRIAALSGQPPGQIIPIAARQ